MHNRPLASCVGSEYSLSAADEQVLLQGVLEGRTSAWRAFQVQFDRLILRSITRALGREVSPDDIQEVYATLLVQLVADDMRKLRSFDASRGTRLSSWVAMLATHCAYDFMRSSRFEACRAPLSEAEVIPCRCPSPLETIEHKEQAALLTWLLGTLPDKDREFVDLYFGEELPPEEIAERMRISVKTVYTKRHKIQSRLEAMISFASVAA